MLRIGHMIESSCSAEEFIEYNSREEIQNGMTPQLMVFFRNLVYARGQFQLFEILDFTVNELVVSGHVPFERAVIPDNILKKTEQVLTEYLNQIDPEWEIRELKKALEYEKMKEKELTEKMEQQKAEEKRLINLLSPNRKTKRVRFGENQIRYFDTDLEDDPP